MKNSDIADELARRWVGADTDRRKVILAELTRHYTSTRAMCAAMGFPQSSLIAWRDKHAPDIKLRDGRREPRRAKEKTNER